MSLPITARQLTALRALQQADPDLGELAASIALAFDASQIDNPQLARIILQNTCRRIAADQPGGAEALIQHLETFGHLNCLSSTQVTDFTDRIKKMSQHASMHPGRSTARHDRGRCRAGSAGQPS